MLGSPFRRRRLRHHRRDAERGAALVETGLVAMPLLIMALGLVEFGLMWSDKMALDRASRSAARVAAQLGDDEQADREALRALVSNLQAQDRVEIEYVVVFELVAGKMVPACEVVVHGLPHCNQYPASSLADLDDDSAWGCRAGAHDSWWCPTDRESELHDPVDLGVLIVAKRDGVTGLFGDEFDLESETIFRLNPIHR